MQKLWAAVMVLGLLAGCASWQQSICEGEDQYWENRARIGAYLAIAEVGMPFVVAAVNAAKSNALDPAKVEAGAGEVFGRAAVVEWCLDNLARLFFEVVCPTAEDVTKAEAALSVALAAQAEVEEAAAVAQLDISLGDDEGCPEGE
jgi:hypothetical protein